MDIRLKWLLHLPDPEHSSLGQNQLKFRGEKMMGSSRGRTIACDAYYARLH